MIPRTVRLHVTDHAVLRYLELKFGVDVGAVRQHLSGLAMTAAQLGAVTVKTERVKLHLLDVAEGEAHTVVDVVNVEQVHRPRGHREPEARDD